MRRYISILSAYPWFFCTLPSNYNWFICCILEIFFACLKFRLQHVDPNCGPHVLFLLHAEYSALMCGVCPRTVVTWQLHRLSMIYSCVLRLWSLMYVAFLSYWLLDCATMYCCVMTGYLEPKGWPLMWEMVMDLSSTQVRVWLLQNTCIYDLCCQTELLCYQSLP